jgi:hypothetical protein
MNQAKKMVKRWGGKDGDIHQLSEKDGDIHQLSEREKDGDSHPSPPER